LQSIRVTLKYTVMAIPLYMAAGLGLSLLLNLKIKGMNVFRTILFIPAVLSGVAVAILWVSLLNPDVGAVNWLLRAIGVVHPPRWLGSPTWAVPSMVIVGLWGVGGGAIIYLAGLQNIPPQLYEAALVDGAGTWQRFRYVTWPMLTPTMLFVLLTDLIGAFQVFDVAWILGGSRGGVGNSLRFYLINLWNQAFVNGRYGYASALAWVLVLMAAGIILAIFRTSGRWVYYEYDPDKV
jgi:multiple sugar transport system permease protein